MAAAVLADKCKLETSIPRVLQFADHKALLIERFDRQVDENGAVTRIHQEDFAQALGLPPEMKYERYKTESRAFNIESIRSVLDQCIRPAEAIDTFMKATIFNLAIGNTDNHAKNFALLYDNGRVPRLAPLYDMLPIKLNSQYTHELAYNIGNASHSDDLSKEDFDIFFSKMGLTKTASKRFKDDAVCEILSKLDIIADEVLVQSGLKDFDSLFGTEAENLIEKLDLDLTLADRDFYAANAGGWSFS